LVVNVLTLMGWRAHGSATRHRQRVTCNIYPRVRLDLLHPMLPFRRRVGAACQTSQFNGAAALSAIDSSQRPRQFPVDDPRCAYRDDLAVSVPWYEFLLGAKPILDEDTVGHRHTDRQVLSAVAAPQASLAGLGR
jgi:hypothetical protein